jgi:hypothetical protein
MGSQDTYAIQPCPSGFEPHPRRPWSSGRIGPCHLWMSGPDPSSILGGRIILLIFFSLGCWTASRTATLDCYLNLSGGTPRTPGSFQCCTILALRLQVPRRWRPHGPRAVPGGVAGAATPLCCTGHACGGAAAQSAAWLMRHWLQPRP